MRKVALLIGLSVFCLAACGHVNVQQEKDTVPVVKTTTLPAHDKSPTAPKALSHSNTTKKAKVIKIFELDGHVFEYGNFGTTGMIVRSQKHPKAFTKCEQLEGARIEQWVETPVPIILCDGKRYRYSPPPREDWPWSARIYKFNVRHP